MKIGACHRKAAFGHAVGGDIQFMTITLLDDRRLYAPIHPNAVAATQQWHTILKAVDAGVTSHATVQVTLYGHHVSCTLLYAHIHTLVLIVCIQVDQMLQLIHDVDDLWNAAAFSKDQQGRAPERHDKTGGCNSVACSVLFILLLMCTVRRCQASFPRPVPHPAPGWCGRGRTGNHVSPLRNSSGLYDKAGWGSWRVPCSGRRPKQGTHEHGRGCTDTFICISHA